MDAGSVAILRVMYVMALRVIGLDCRQLLISVALIIAAGSLTWDSIGMPATEVIDKAAFVPPFRITGPPTAFRGNSIEK